jgi:hypothetical protein
MYTLSMDYCSIAYEYDYCHTYEEQDHRYNYHVYWHRELLFFFSDDREDRD